MRSIFCLPAVPMIAHTLHLDILAEGVEAEEQLAFLKAHECDFYQGYLKSPPVPVDGFEKLLRTIGTKN